MTRPVLPNRAQAPVVVTTVLGIGLTAAACWPAWDRHGVSDLLERYVEYQEDFFAREQRYTSDLSAARTIFVTGTYGITLTIYAVTPTGHSAAAYHENNFTIRCGVRVGDAPAPLAGDLRDGIPVCRHRRNILPLPTDEPFQAIAPGDALNVTPEAAVLDAPAPTAELVDTLRLGEQVRLRAEVVDTGATDAFVPVLLSDGKEGWMAAADLVVGAQPAVTLGLTPVHPAPDQSSTALLELQPLRFVAAGRQVGDWIEITRPRERWIGVVRRGTSSSTLDPTGWVRAETVSVQAEDVVIGAWMTAPILMPRWRRARRDRLLGTKALATSSLRRDALSRSGGTPQWAVLGRQFHQLGSLDGDGYLIRFRIVDGVIAGDLHFSDPNGLVGSGDLRRVVYDDDDRTISFAATTMSNMTDHEFRGTMMSVVMDGVMWRSNAGGVQADTVIFVGR